MKKKFLTLAFSFLFLIFNGCSGNQELQFLIKGDDIGYLLFGDFINEFNASHKNSEFSFVGGGSQLAINAMVDGTCKIVFTLKKLNNEDLALLKAKNIYSYEVPLVTVPVLVIGNSSLPIDKVTLKDISQIYSGLSRYWWQLAKNPAEKKALSLLDGIDLCALDQRNGENFFVREKLNLGDFTLDTKYFGHSKALIQYVAQNQGAIGFLSVPFYNENLDKLKILYFEPNFETTGYLFFNKSLSDSPSVKQFIEELKIFLKKRSALLLQKGIRLIEY